VQLVVDPHGQQAISVESLDGELLGQATPLDLIANNHRRRHRPVNTDVDSHPPPQTINAVDQAHQNYIDQFNLQTPDGQE
jgi:hypothetical protein